MTPMQRSNKQFDEARSVRIEVGEQIFRYLAHNFAAKTAIAVATNVEFFLGLQWEREQEQMRSRQDPSKVFEISIEAMAQARAAYIETRTGDSDLRAEQHVLKLLAGFPVDQQWWTVHRTKKELVGWCGRRPAKETLEPAGVS